MLLADKHDLQEQLKLSLVLIEEKELNFYTQNCYTVGTQAAHAPRTRSSGTGNLHWSAQGRWPMLF